jgi:amino acid adenylation domain-containing protein
MLFHQLYDTSSHQYVLHEQLAVAGAFDPARARQALRLLALRHESLRLAVMVPKASGRPRQVLLANRDPQFEVIDVSGLPEDQRQARVDQLAAQDIATGFDLAKDPLARVTLIVTGHQRAVALWCFNHLVVDGWSVPILMADFARFYAQLESVPADRLEAAVRAEAQATASFSDYLRWAAAQTSDDSLEFWRALLDGFEEVSRIEPLGIAEPDTDDQVRVAQAGVDPETAAELKRVCAAEGITMATMVSTAWGLTVARHARTRDVVFGQVVSGRDAEIDGLQGVAGMLINTIPVRVTLRPGDSLRDLLRHVQDQALAVVPHARTPLADIQHLTPLGKDLVTSMVAFENYFVDPSKPLRLPGLEITVLRAREQTSYALSLRATGPEHLDLLYDPRQFSDAEARLIVRRVAHVLSQMAREPGLSLDDVELADAAERAQVLADFNDTAAPFDDDQTMGGLLERAAAAHPDRPALVWADQTVTFAELNRRVNRLARRLRQLGVGPERTVGLMARRGIDQIVGIYAVAKAGGAWVPIDPTYPISRIEFLIQDCAPVAILVADCDCPVETDRPVVHVSDPALEDFDPSDLEPLAGPGNLAYIIYTSGTTGHPKGVLIEHRGVVNYSAHLARAWELEDDDVVLQFSNYTFDASILDHCAGVMAGHTMCLLPEAVLLNETEFLDYVASHRVTAGLIAPAYFLQAGAPAAMRLISTGGAASSPEVVAKAATHAHYVNSYGPTEITVVAVEWHYDAPGPIPNPVPIGRPIANALAYVMDNGRLCGVGLPGELCIGGPGVARGYLGLPELTAERFTPNPFGPGRIYHTGDLVRWRLDGTLVYLGRLDDQVKIRGFRIEPAEIESAMRSCPGVSDAAVLVGEGPSLHGFYIADRPVEPAQVKARLVAELPAFMIPASLARVDAFPLNRSGKIDARALMGSGRPTPAAAATPPRTAAERAVANAFGTALQLESVGVEDAFFDIGGDSLSAIRAVTRLTAEGFECTVRDVFESPTVEALAARITAAADAAATPAVPPAPRSAGPPPASGEPWEIERALARLAPELERQAAAVEARPVVQTWESTPGQALTRRLGVAASHAVIAVDRPWDAALFARVWDGIARDHPALRAAIAPDGSVAVHAPGPDQPIPVLDVSGHSPGQTEELAHALARRANPFADQPDRATLAHRVAVLAGADRFTAVVPLSHLVFDAFSLDALTSRLLRDYRSGAPAATGPATLRDFRAFLDFLAAGPSGATDAEIVDALGLEAFAAAAADWPGATTPTAGFECDAGPDPAALAWRLIRAALDHAHPGRTVPALLIHAGRLYAHADFTAHIGEFLDVLPLAIGPDQTDLADATGRALGFARAADLVVAGLMEGRWAGAFPRATALLGAADPTRLPLVNLVLTPLDRLPTAPTPAEPGAAPSRVINAMAAGGRLRLDNLPCSDPETLARLLQAVAATAPPRREFSGDPHVTTH